MVHLTNTPGKRSCTVRSARPTFQCSKKWRNVVRSRSGLI